MNKYLLLAGLGTLFFSDALPQNKMSRTLPDALLMPFSAIPPADAGASILVDEATLRTGDRVYALSAKGDTQFVSQLQKHRLHGSWKSWYTSVLHLDSGRLERSVPDGEWRTWYPDGHLRSIRTYHATKLARVKNEIRKRNARDNFFVITDIAKENLPAAKKLLTANYSFNSLVPPDTHAPEIMNLQNRVLYNIAVTNNSYLPPFTECLHHGLYMNYYPNGKVKDSGYYKNGVREGIWEEWQEQGAIRATGLYKRGVKKGDWRYFDSNRKLLYVQWFNSRGRVTNTVKMK